MAPHAKHPQIAREGRSGGCIGISQKGRVETACYLPRPTDEGAKSILKQVAATPTRISDFVSQTIAQVANAPVRNMSEDEKYALLLGVHALTGILNP